MVLEKKYVVLDGDRARVCVCVCVCVCAKGLTPTITPTLSQVFSKLTD